MSGSEASPLHLIVVGPPASGKGTQARHLAREFGLRYLSTGALLREHVERLSDVGRLAKPILDRGGYLPDGLMCRMVEGWIGEAATGWILDGFPRSVPQAEFLERWLADRGQSLHAAIALEAPLERLVARIRGRVECPGCRWSGGSGELLAAACPACGGVVEPRADDTDANFRSRFDNYVDSAQPLIEHYRQRGLLCSCDATLARDEVTSHLMSRLAAIGDAR